MKKLLRNRCVYVAFFLVLTMLVIIGRLYQLQIIDGDSYYEQASHVIDSTKAVPIEAPRGNIYDRNGLLLATTRTSYKVQMVNVNNPQEERNEMYLNLINLFETNEDVYINNFSKYISYPIDWGTSLKGEEREEARRKWINKIAIKKSDRDNLTSAQAIFEYLRDERFEISGDYTDEEVYKIMIIRYETFMNGLSSLTPTVLATDCSEKTMQEIEANYLNFPGISTEETYFREYVDAVEISHILGYVRAINEEEYAEMKDLGYSNESIIGKIGIEKAAESYLKGKEGTKNVYLDSEGVLREASRTEAMPGNDVYLTIDYGLQKKCVDILHRGIENIKAQKDDEKNFGDAEAGSIVVMNVKTGETLAMANYPNYDNSIFLAPSSDKEAQQAIINMFNDEKSPSLNRATQGLYPVGSTFKPVTAVAALESDKITQYSEVKCDGYLMINNHKHSCMGRHGYISLKKAIAKSCNVYFQQIGVNTGVDTIDYWAKSFGLGEKTGIEIDEYAGYRSNEETMELKESDIYHVWTESDTAQTAIGQLYTLFTPVQLARYTAALGNGGYLNNPFLIGSVKSASGEVVLDNSTKNQNITKLNISKETLSSVHEGMVQMAGDSSVAKEAFSKFPKGFVAAKTGTPETGLEAFGESSHSVFICYAPANDPEIAVSIVIEHGAAGSNSIPLAGEVLEAYFLENTLKESGIPTSVIKTSLKYLNNKTGFELAV